MLGEEKEPGQASVEGPAILEIAVLGVASCIEAALCSATHPVPTLFI